jgi:choline dehydrogenase-like flavoprotein
MICAGDSLADGGQTEAEVAIVGAGPVGIALAMRLLGRVGRIFLIEAGTDKFAPVESASYFRAAEVNDPRHMPTELYRRRMLGGTSTIWGGRCTAFDPEDFAPAAGRSGWPITYAQMQAHVAEALEFFDAGSAEYSASTVFPRHGIPPDPAGSDLVLDRIERWSKPTDAWRKFGSVLGRSADVTVIYGAACVNIVTSDDGNRVSSLSLRTSSGRLHVIRAPTTVLACAGFETPRLLLASRGQRSCGIGNEHDLVGRFYMAHLASDARNAGAIRFANPAQALAFDFEKMRDGIYGRRVLLLSPAARKREGIGNIVFRPSRPPIDDAAHRDPVLSAMFLARSVLIPAEYMRSMAVNARVASLLTQTAHIGNVVRGIPKLGGFGIDWMRRRVFARRKLPAVFLYRKDGSYPLEFNAEHRPNRDSRVRLGDEVDPFGVPRLIVEWRMGEDEIEGIGRAYRLLAAAVAQSGLGEVLLDADLHAGIERTLVAQGGVHIGTARMGDDARSGVVDGNGEVWGTRGLFVAGTATFVSSGFASPTLTAVALAFRLGDHLIARQSGRPAVG